MVYRVEARRDPEGGVWVAESEDLPGLLAEGESPNTLTKKLRTLIPELLARLMDHPSPRVTGRYYIHVAEPHVASGFERFLTYLEQRLMDAAPAAASAEATGIST